MTNGLVDAFEKETGATVDIRFGEDEGLANQIVEEGSASPADVFLAENAPPLILLSDKGSAGSGRSVHARLGAEAVQLGKGRLGGRRCARDGAHLQPEPHLCERAAEVGPRSRRPAVGRQALDRPVRAGLRAARRRDHRARRCPGSGAVAGRFRRQREALQRQRGDRRGRRGRPGGRGVINHYYWFSETAELGADKVNSKLYYFGHQDPGALVDVSGAGVLASSDNQDLAQQFLAFITSKAGQDAMVAAGDWEYPLNPDATLPTGLKPFDQLDPPQVTPSGARRRTAGRRADPAGGAALAGV